MNGGRLPVVFSTPAGNDSFERALMVATAAEEAGFTSVAFSDRPHDPILDGWTLAAAVAARTQRIRFWHSTLNLPFRFPAVLAKEAATLDLISGGRLDLCLGAGGEGNRPLYDTVGVPLAAPGERLQDLRDAIAILRGMWSQDKFSYAGRVHKVENAAGEPKPVQRPIPIWVGARMPRSLRLAGQVADGYIKNGGWGSVEELRELNQAVDAAARRAGRDPGALRHLLNGGAFIGSSAEVEAYRQRTAGAPQSGPAGVAGLVGTPDEVIGIIHRYREAGVDMFNLRFQATDSLEQIKRFGREVIPAAARL